MPDDQFRESASFNESYCRANEQIEKKEERTPPNIHTLKARHQKMIKEKQDKQNRHTHPTLAAVKRTEKQKKQPHKHMHTTRAAKRHERKAVRTLSLRKSLPILSAPPHPPLPPPPPPTHTHILTLFPQRTFLKLFTQHSSPPHSSFAGSITMVA